jgi:hypothetical protein
VTVGIRPPFHFILLRKLAIAMSFMVNSLYWRRRRGELIPHVASLKWKPANHVTYLSASRVRLEVRSGACSGKRDTTSSPLIRKGSRGSIILSLTQHLRSFCVPTSGYSIRKTDGAPVCNACLGLNDRQLCGSEVSITIPQDAFNNYKQREYSSRCLGASQGNKLYVQEAFQFRGLIEKLLTYDHDSSNFNSLNHPVMHNTPFPKIILHPNTPSKGQRGVKQYKTPNAIRY